MLFLVGNPLVGIYVHQPLWRWFPIKATILLQIRIKPSSRTAYYNGQWGVCPPPPCPDQPRKRHPKTQKTRRQEKKATCYTGSWVLTKTTEQPAGLCFRHHSLRRVRALRARGLARRRTIKVAPRKQTARNLSVREPCPQARKT